MHEDLLRHIWSKQLFNTSLLKTSDGRPVRIVYPGTLSRKSGPDFRDARIEIQGTLYHGDVEFHRSFEDWYTHRHHLDRNYNSVILHVVAFGKGKDASSQSGRTIPTVFLEPLLNTSILQDHSHLSREEYHSRSNSLRCSEHNHSIESEMLPHWIDTLYRERLQEKTDRLYQRLCDIIVEHQRIVGEPHPPYHEMIDDIPTPHSDFDKQLFKQKIAWEQLLYEEVMDGLGYSNNRKPMKQLAQNIPLLTFLRMYESLRMINPSFTVLSSSQIETILMMASGMLPSINEIQDQDSKVYIHSLRSIWEELPERINLSPLDRTAWNFSPTRPANFPTIRIAAASVFIHRLISQSLLKSIITIVAGKFSSPSTKIEQLIQLLEPGVHPFWNYHYSFTEQTHRKHSLLGDSRIFDILVNIIVPFVIMYGKVFGKNDILEHILNIAVILPKLGDNVILKTMNSQLIKRRVKIEFAYQQQSLIQLYHRYCNVGRCNDCQIGRRIFS